MNKQLFCSKCGKTQRSQWFETCECQEPDFSFKTYDEYVKSNADSAEKTLEQMLGRYGYMVVKESLEKMRLRYQNRRTSPHKEEQK